MWCGSWQSGDDLTGLSQENSRGKCSTLGQQKLTILSERPGYQLASKQASKLVSSTSLAGSVRRRLEKQTNHAATFHMSPSNSRPQSSADESGFNSNSLGNALLYVHESWPPLSLHQHKPSPRKRLKINSCNLPEVCACSVTIWQCGGGAKSILGAPRTHFSPLPLILSTYLLPLSPHFTSR